MNKLSPAAPRARIADIHQRVVHTIAKDTFEIYFVPSVAEWIASSWNGRSTGLTPEDAVYHAINSTDSATRAFGFSRALLAFEGLSKPQKGELLPNARKADKFNSALHFELDLGYRMPEAEIANLASELRRRHPNAVFAPNFERGKVEFSALQVTASTVLQDLILTPNICITHVGVEYFHD